MRRDWPDILGGLALAAIGAAAAGWALVHYDAGSLRQMGPGAFPLVLGAMLAVIGLVVALPALGRAGDAPAVEPWAAVAVLASILVFGLGLRPLGLVVASFAGVVVATLPAPRRGWVWRICLAVVVTALTVLIFRAGLQMSLPLWPRGV
ncbi:tripartite tricarboxylate transporter TctB family protein [Palleronia sp. LCG004]|uniref:tripartite tricarboxylate transporter TctB family protein n=1 Tax=Palleronia sp. LCG004 TaxID=3079304 RepID=UPI002943488E|nr:tripartite tricarboxylate transporter TctB family protein [Palleronia sp. LCG004]WOI56820.1 tripartite tricarboxylate transporter TctB family protein [Palleronia sp. LCG004]